LRIARLGKRADILLLLLDLPLLVSLQ
jgi:hypothetical protein